MAGNTTLTLGDVVNELKINNKSQDKTNKNLEDYFKYLERQRLDQLESLREMMKGDSKSRQRNARDGSSVSSTNLNFPKYSLEGLAASFAALALALAGFRGWEVDAIKSVGRGLKNFKTNLVNGARNISLSILRALGIDEVQRRDARGRFMKGKDFNIFKPIRLAVDDIQKSLTQFFRPLIDASKYIKGKFTGGITGGVSRGFLSVIKTIFEGPVSVVRYFAGLTGGAFTGITDWTKKFGGGKFGGLLKGFLRKVLSILKPIGFLFSAFEGVQAFQGKEGDLFDKIGAGTGAFLGDFFGSFLNLIKSATSWVLGKMGFKNAEKFLDGLDFKKMIRELVEGVFAFTKKAVKWVEKLFSDPGAALEELYNGTFSKGGFIDKFIFKPISQVGDWIAKKFGWKDEDAPPFDLHKTITSWIDGVLNWLDMTWKSIKIFFTQLPDRISLFFQEGWVKLVTNLKVGWEKLGAFFADLPNKLLLIGLEGVKKTFGEAAFKFANLDKVVASAKADSQARSDASKARIQSLQGVKNDQLAQIQAERQALDDVKAKTTTPVVMHGGTNNSNNTTVVSGGSGGGRSAPPAPRNMQAQPGWATGGY
jgi:hypothetical protein